MMEIASPRRILAVSSTESAELLCNVIKDLTGTHPLPSDPSDPTSIAGTTHPLPLTTAYYRASVPVWLDLAASPAEWAASFLSPDAREVLAVLGAVVVVFPLAAARPGRDHLVGHVGRLVAQGLGGWAWDGVAVALGVGDPPPAEDLLGEWEDVCAEAGLEFVHIPANGLGRVGAEGAQDRRNEFGEKMGIQRALEALQANDWAQAEFGDDYGEDGDSIGEALASGDLKGTETGAGRGSDAAGDEDDDRELDPESLDFGFDKEDFVGLRKAIWAAGGEDEEESTGRPGGRLASGEAAAETGGGDAEDEALDEDDVQKIDEMMKKLLAVKDMSAGLPEEQRKRLAKRAVEEVMREL